MKIKTTFIVAVSILSTIAIPTSAFYFNQPLVDLWNVRTDLQKAFPKSPQNNRELEEWAKKYGWRENTELYEFYPDKAIIEKIINAKVENRIKSLESQIQILEIKNRTTILPIQETKISEKRKTRKCYIRGDGAMHCPATQEDKERAEIGTGWIIINILTE